MKHIYPLFLLVLLLYSCSKIEPLDGHGDPDGNPDPESLEACFTLSSESIFVGETLEISNCSEGASSYSYDFGNGDTSSDASPEVAYSEGGTYTITLTVTNTDKDTEHTTALVNVIATESYYLYPDIPEGYSYLPLETGIHPITGTPYCIELQLDLVGPGGSKFFFRSLDANYDATTNYIADMPYNSNSAFVNFLANGNQNFHFPRTLTGLYGSQELTYTSGWGFISNINPADKHSYGYLVDGVNYLYYGTADDGGTYKAAIEHRNAGGDTYQIDLHALGSADSMIGDMIAVDGGYIAFGGVFTKNDLPPQITGYKPVLAFFDTALNLTTAVVLSASVLDSHITSPNDLNGTYHLVQLSNGNLAAYGNGELIVTDAGGTLLKHTYFNDTNTIQAMISLGSSFVISTNLYLRKFDANGEAMKTLKYNGNYLPEILEKDGKLFFISAYDTEDGIKEFYGAVDQELTLKPLSI